MQHLDHDMDDLFRKAAADYPLKTSEDDWDKLSAKLQVMPGALATPGRKRFIYIGLILAVILLFLILGGLYYNYERTSKNRNVLSTINSSKIRIDKERNAGHLKSSKPAITIMQQGLTKSLEEGVSNHEKVLTNSAKKLLIKQAIKRSYDDSAQRIKQRKGTIKSIRANTFSYHTLQNLELADKQASDLNFDLKSAHVRNTRLMNDASIVEPALKAPAIKISSRRFRSQGGLYLGLIGGPEFSKVGSQTSTRTGYHAGILIGYHLNKKLSIESGLMLGRNNYYSAGSYFNMSKISSSMPAGMEIITLDGQNTHIEMPVIFKYNFFHRQHADLFFTAGLISDLYLQEKNYYQTMLNGVNDNLMGVYNQNHFYLASQTRISIGYEHILGRSGIIRIEPYKNIPLQQSGMGSMPVFSSGFNVGLLHAIGK